MVRIFAIAADANRDPVLSRRRDEPIAVAGVKVDPTTRRQVEIARQACRDFGKGSGHPPDSNPAVQSAMDIG